MRSPLGFEITPDIEAEVAADPTRLPAKLQTPDRKAELLNDLTSHASGTRHQAIGQLAAWDPDPEVAAALRPMLISDDVFEASQAATGLARQGDITDFPSAAGPRPPHVARRRRYVRGDAARCCPRP